MEDNVILTPAKGSRIVQSDSEVLLFGQPPEVLKGLLLNNITKFDTLVLADVKEKDGSLTNNLEFPFYFFLFVANGLARGEKLNLVGEPDDISQALRLLRYTLIGPTETELACWHTDKALAAEWLEVARALALKDSDDEVLPVESFFHLRPFENGVAKTAHFTIRHLGSDHYKASCSDGEWEVDLNEDQEIVPPYQVQSDYVPGGLIKMGLEVLGGASGFTPNEPCTGLALCYNGDYILIDSIPFLDQHLYARGISKNQVSAVLLTHLHDDHCSMFPLMLMPHKVEIITTREIFNMAMEKLACNLGWHRDVIAEHFTLIEVDVGVERNFYGLNIEPHVTVHSIPTIGATFSTIHRGYTRQLCVVGDNHSMTTSRQLCQDGLVRPQTVERLEHIYTDRFSLLVADGGAGAIHGDPADALTSKSDRVVFVHVETLPNEFDTTFSLASSGKRYTVIDGDTSIYTSQINHYLSLWLGEKFPNRWLRSLLAEEEVRKYNAGDVIIVQDAETRGFVYLILTGYCEVVRHDGKQFHTVANLQAGDIVGEMAVITGTGVRNASVVASTPVTVCVFAEETFRAFIETEGFREKLLRRWSLRPAIKALPQFAPLTTTVIEKVCNGATWLNLAAGEDIQFSENAWYILSDGTVTVNGEELTQAEEFGWRPFTSIRLVKASAVSECSFIRIKTKRARRLLDDVPQLNYTLRKFRVTCGDPSVNWLLGDVPIN